MNRLAIFGIFALALAAAGAVEITEEGVLFTLEKPAADKVFVAGDFNDWTESANPLEKEGDTWKAVIDIPPGTYEYKFIVDGTYITDPGNPNTVSDPYGGKNSLLEVSGESPEPATPAGRLGGRRGP